MSTTTIVTVKVQYGGTTTTVQTVVHQYYSSSSTVVMITLGTLQALSSCTVLYHTSTRRVFYADST